MRSQVKVARDDLRVVERLLTSDETWRQEHLSSEFRQEEVSSEFRQEVGKRLGSYFRERHLDLDGVLDDLEAGKPLDQCWGRLRSVRTQTEKTLRESLAFLAGLLVRRARLDVGFCAVVERLLGELAGVMPPQISWAKGVILDVGDSFTPMSSIIRTRFPEFTVWALPIVGHEVGHVVMQELRRLSPDARSHAYPLVELAAVHGEAYVRAGKKPPRGGASARAKALGDTFVRELFGDFFAVYALGVSYACSALLVRFEPWQADLPDSAHPPQVERAHLIVRTLREVHGGFGNVADILDETWNQLLSSCGVPAADKETAVPRLDGLAAAFLATAERHLSDARYLGRQTASSLVASLEPGQGQPAAPTGSSIRDVLNAAWIARLRKWDAPKDVEAIESSAMKLCRRIAATGSEDE